MRAPTAISRMGFTFSSGPMGYGSALVGAFHQGRAGVSHCAFEHQVQFCSGDSLGTELLQAAIAGSMRMIGSRGRVRLARWQFELRRDSA
jgi:hypothetical protein